MLARALIAFLALPGVVAGLVPALLVALDGRRGGGGAYGFMVLGLGLFCLLWCVRDFLVTGRGTLAPWEPPRHLVVVGLYRFVRNPMYVSVLTVVVGWWLATGSRLLTGYATLLAIGFHLRVLYHEEPWLLRQFGDEWVAYSASVRRWLPRLRPWKQDNSGQMRQGERPREP
jgi:protein-S-isoprenylcysteine O-methyltransferase Ste14